MGHSNVDVENPYKSWEVERDWAMDLDFFVEVGGMTQGTSIPSFLGNFEDSRLKAWKTCRNVFELFLRQLDRWFLGVTS